MIQNCGGRTLTKALLVSVFNLVQVGWWAATRHALQLSIPYTYYLLVVPIMSLALLVPQSVALACENSCRRPSFVVRVYRRNDLLR